jgi:HSP20 family protein
MAMALAVREAAAPLARLHDEIDRMFQNFPMTGFWSWGDGAGRAPSIDLYEKDGSLYVEAELPGIAKQDVQVGYTDHSVVIQAETKKEEEEKREGYYRSERRRGSYYRVVPMPEDVDFAKATAEFKDGVLKIALPKQAPAEKPSRKIPIAG